MRGLGYQCWEAFMDYCPWWMRLCEKNKWFEDNKIGWVADKAIKLHLTPPALYIISDLLFSLDWYQRLRSHWEYKRFRLSLN